MRFRAVRDRLAALAVILVILLFDVFTKRWAIDALSDTAASVQGIDGLVGFRFVWNPGAAFSFLSHAPNLVTALTACLLAALAAAVFLPPREKLSNRLFLSMVLAGGAGNLIDRLLYGAVADFIELKFISFPVFNFADIMVVSGAVLYAIQMCFPIKKGGVK